MMLFADVQRLINISISINSYLQIFLKKKNKFKNGLIDFKTIALRVDMIINLLGISSNDIQFGTTLIFDY